MPEIELETPTAKTYMGVRLSDPGHAPGAGSNHTPIVYVVVREMHVYVNDEGRLGSEWVTAQAPTLLPHICTTPAGQQWRREYICHSPDGFEWGYSGSGPAELAAMILYDLGLDPAVVWRLHQHFKNHFLAPIGEDVWMLEEEELREWARQQLEELEEPD